MIREDLKVSIVLSMSEGSDKRTCALRCVYKPVWYPSWLFTEYITTLLQSNCSERSRQGGGACALVATIDQIRITTPVQEERGSRVRRTFSLLRERFESCREPPPPAAPWAARECVSPPRFVSVKDMRAFFLRQVLTPPKLAALKRKMVTSPVP